MNLVRSIELLNVVVAQAEPGAGPDPMGGLLAVGPLLLAGFFIIYFMTILPQQRKDKARRAMLDALSKGDEVITTGGICGQVVRVKEADVILDVGKDVHIKFVRNSIAHVIKDEDKKDA
jgi:preprotein translocase subunit YajC